MSYILFLRASKIPQQLAFNGSAYNVPVATILFLYFQNGAIARSDRNV